MRVTAWALLRKLAVRVLALAFGAALLVQELFGDDDDDEEDRPRKRKSKGKDGKDGADTGSKKSKAKPAAA